MENPFDKLLERLDVLTEKVEQALKNQLNEDGLRKDEFVKIDEAAAILNIEIRTLYDYTSRRKIRHYKPGSTLYFKRSDIDEYISKGLVEVNHRIIKGT